MAPAGYTPAAFFLHFGPPYPTGQAAIDRHLQFFRHTGMDFVKVQFEQDMPQCAVASPADWARAPRLTAENFEPTVRVVRGLVEAAGRDALVLLTLYSPFMWARHLAGDEVLHEHLAEHPAQALKGLEISTENVLTLVAACKAAGVDGLYAPTQGGEAFRFGGTDIFARLVKPTRCAWRCGTRSGRAAVISCTSATMRARTTTWPPSATTPATSSTARWRWAAST